MGIFSLFGKKEQRQPETPQARKARKSTSADSGSSKRDVRPRVQPLREAGTASQTFQKIDAIEFEMSSEFGKARNARSTPSPRRAVAEHASPVAAVQEAVAASMSLVASTTSMLFNDDGQFTLHPSSALESGAEVMLEQAAIVFAGQQFVACEQILNEIIRGDETGPLLYKAWWMLFDLYQVMERRSDFDALCLAYATRFESSPPAWIAPTKRPAQEPVQLRTMPTVAFTGRLDASCRRQTERLAKLADGHRALRLEFMRVTELTPEGCGLLAAVLKRLQKSGHDLVLLGAPQLVARLRSRLATGLYRREEACWLLMLEILQLLNLEQEFEQASLDYCILFEVSPPAFAAPASKVTTALAEVPQQEQQQEQDTHVFPMPAVIDGPVDALVNALLDHTRATTPALVDCTGLHRIAFNSASQLAMGLAARCDGNPVLEFRHVSHLVAALLTMTGMAQVARIHPRKY